MHYDSREIICREGEFTNALYIVQKGYLEGTTLQGKKNSYGPGSIVGEFCLVENSPCIETLTALTDCEIQIIDTETFQDTLKGEPTWVSSIIQFLSKRSRIAEDDFRKNQKIRALPALLYLLINSGTQRENENIILSKTVDRMKNLSNLSEDLIQELFSILQDLDLLKLHSSVIQIKNFSVIKMLYDAILHRALRKEPSPLILSITEQMVLTAVIKATQESKTPLKNGTCTVETETLKNICRKVTHGMTLTMRNMVPLLKKKILETSSANPIHSDTDIDTIPFFFGDFDHILDLMELNRIFPLLDKKLVE